MCVLCKKMSKKNLANPRAVPKGSPAAGYTRLDLLSCLSVNKAKARASQ